ncbi:hypothetical protein EMIT0P4_30210 [Pseudomonas sp. IT-P4]
MILFCENQSQKIAAFGSSYEKPESPYICNIDNRQSFTLNPRGCLTIMARFHFPAREPPRCCVSAKKL